MPKRPDLDYSSSHAGPPTAPPPPTPLAIILKAMHKKYGDEDLDAAVALARIAAPYIHPRASATTAATGPAAMPDAELDALQAQA